MQKYEDNNSAVLRLGADVVIQINYYIIRTVYDIINGYLSSPNPDEDFYDLMDISKSSYDKLVNKGWGYDFMQKATRWHKDTGIDLKIFTGEEFFNEDGLDYKDLCELIEDKRQKIRIELKSVLNKEIADPNLQALIKFAKYKNSVIQRDTVLSHVRSISKAIDLVDLKQLSLLNEAELTEFISDLDDYIEVCKAARVLVRYQSSSKSKKKEAK